MRPVSAGSVAPTVQEVSRRRSVEPDLSRIRRVLRWVIECGQACDPARLRRVPGEVSVGRLALVMVYREANAPGVRALLSQLPADALVRLWALDRVEESLADRTIGCGSGGRLDHYNRLVADLGTESYDFLVMCDDDLRLRFGDLQRLLMIGRWMELDLFQPAHCRRSHTAFAMMRKQWFLLGRQTTFVEQGPMLVLSPRARELMLPLPSDFGMGWGIEVRWHELAARLRLRLGVVDAVAVLHRTKSGRSYDTAPEVRRLNSELARAGYAAMDDLCVEIARYGALSAAQPRAACSRPLDP